MTLRYEPIVTTSVSKQISERIREAILTGELQAGDRLPTEDDLAQKYQVSRPTIREALKRLAAQNLIYSRRGPTGGSFVLEPNPSSAAEALTGAATLLVSVGAFDFDEITAARFELESSCFRLATQNWTPEDLERMEAALAAHSDRSISDQEFCAADVRFHRAIVDSAHNAPLQFVMYAVIEALLPITNLVIFRVRSRETIISFHEKIMEGIRRRDAAQSIEALRFLLDYLREQYRTAPQVRASNPAGDKAPVEFR